MIIKAKPLPLALVLIFGRVISFLLKRKFNKMKLVETEILPDHAYLYLSNHFSFLDGFIALHIICTELYKKKKVIKNMYFLILDKQLQQNKWMKLFGAFPINPRSIQVKETLAYSASLLNNPGNVLVLFPQGRIESNHVREIDVKAGITEIIPLIKGNCQILYTSNLIDYFEGIKPSLYTYMYDCGTNKDFNFEILKDRINQFHKQAVKQQIRFSKETVL